MSYLIPGDVRLVFPGRCLFCTFCLGLGFVVLLSVVGVVMGFVRMVFRVVDLVAVVVA